MASNSIQIYNDTVLKQSVLQGYQVQRTNPNLGRITMGELAFTRDTGRLFVGNYTNIKKENDSKQVLGGILSGNKYLGIVDSKPLIHFSASGETGWKPLSYESDITDKSLNITEKALFGQGSRFRNIDKNGWNKKSQYIEKYGVYSGDYTYDVYNNALILFDKNITTNPVEQPIRRVTEVDGVLTEQILDKSTGEPISVEKHSRRTPLYNTEQNENLNERPIYGDGYVIMRILEPDGTTIGYKNRTFKYDQNNYNSDGSPTSNDNNWSHNYLEILSVPAASLSASFDRNQFFVPTEGQGGVVKLNSSLSGVNELIGINGELTVPKTLSFKNSVSLIFDSAKITSSNVNSDKILVLSKAAGTNTYNVSIANQHIPSYTIQLKDGLRNPITGENFLTITQDSSNAGELSIGLSQSSNSISNVNSIGYSDPFFINQFSNYFYNGTGYYDINGSLIRSQFYDIEYHYAAEEKIKQYDNTTNAGVNLLKEPIPICWNTPNSDAELTSTSSATLEFLVSPYIFCIKKHYLSGEDQEKTVEQDGEITQGGNVITETIDYDAYNKNITVLGNNTYDDLSTPSSFSIIDGLSFDPQNRQMYEKYIQGNTNTTKVPVWQPVNFDVFDTTGYDEEQNPETQDGYEIYNYYGQSMEIPETIYKKTNKWYTYGDKTYTEIQTTISDDQVQLVTKVVATLKPLSSIIKINEIKYPDNVQEIEKDENGNYIESEMPDFFFCLERTTKDFISNVGTTERTAYVPYVTFEGNQLMDISDGDNSILKVEISTSDENKQFITLFDAKEAESYTPNNLYYPDPDSILSVHRTELGKTIYSSLLNAPIFTSNKYAPYFLLVTYETTQEETGLLISYKKYIKVQDINYSEIQPRIPITPIKVVAFVQGTNNTVDITDTYLEDLFVEKNYQMFDTKKLQSTPYKGLCFVYDSEETQYFDINAVVKNWDNSYYTFTKDEVRDVQTVKYRASGYWNTNTADYDNDQFIIESVTLNDGKNTKYLWSDTTQRSKIKELITKGEINLPTGFTVTYDTCKFVSIQIKDVPANENGYFIPETGFVADTVNQRTIPAHASSILLQVHRRTNSNTPISIYTANSIENMSDKSMQYDFPFDITDDDMPTINGTSCLGDYEKILYNSTQTGSQMIEVPLHKTTFNNYKGFTIRVANIDSGNTTNNFLIRAIGYRV